MNELLKPALINREGLPPDWPTHLHTTVFWAALGRTVATFSYLEETLGRAIFALTGTKEYAEDEITEAFEHWLPKLERALSDSLGGLIDLYVKSVREHQGSTIEKLTDLEADLRNAASIRNVLCHGSWRAPDVQGASVPFFVNRKMMVFETAVDIAFLEQTRIAVAGLCCTVVDTVTHMGYRFPGSTGPGKAIWT